MWFFYTLIPCLLIDGVAILPAPQNLSVQSTNMKHLLTWSPVMVPGEIIYYFVEYQGEYESLYMSHVWIPSSWCSPTKGPECDITDDITATVPYNLRVRATQGSETSAWSTLKPPFNRNSTILTPPGMDVTKDGFHLVIKLEDLGSQFEFLVAYWRREPGAKEHVKVVRSRGIPVHLETMEPGAAYCVKVQTFVKAIGRHSPFSQAECVKVQVTTSSLLCCSLSAPPPHPAGVLALCLPPGSCAEVRVNTASGLTHDAPPFPFPRKRF
ncbi:interleukin-20 receptor subunit beta isoform X2 [Lynx rufus]|uniref:interleukin-20 receptor subunit beta isoform X2 n=1 Tax=Lynx rufus TaxID=61384 RepID=UPI00072E6D70|nr:interleukin-20 receptor subunit beta isoform X2 [Lynx rufus]